MLHENGCKGSGVECVKFCNDCKPGEVAHGAEDVLGSIVSWYRAGLPDIGVDDGERGRDWPGVDELAVVADGGVGGDAVRAGFNPGFDVGAHLMPEEVQSDAMECFVCHEVAGSWAGMEDFEQTAAEGLGGNDEKETATEAV